MTHTVSSAFEEFRKNLEPPNYDRTIATKRKEHLLSLLRDDFMILDAFATGSLPKYTAVKGYADLDIFVVLHYGKHAEGKKPSEVLQAVRDSLGEYKTNVRKNGQAVTLYYKTWPNVDVVPVFKTVDEAGNVAHYNVPDMNSESWIKSNPLRHAKKLSKKNQDYGPEFKRIIKMIKWWNHQHSSLLESYHIEVMVLKGLTGKFSNYPGAIYSFFDKAVDLANSPLWYEESFVDSYLTESKRQEVVKRLETARDKAFEAWHRTYGSNADHKGAIMIWRQIFGGEFPAYG